MASPSSPAGATGAVTAGMRGASWTAERLHRPFDTRPCPLATEDGQRVLGFLFSRGGEKGVVFVMHPREMVVTHYLVPDLLDAGWACWVQGPRSVGNDLRLEHELALHDVAAGMRHLRSLGFATIVQLGNSGGAGLFAFYNQQAMLDGERRLRHTPAGRPTKLESANLPVADGLVFLSPHPGQGALLMSGIDPSVTDEADPFSCDPALDPFDAKNGFRRPPESSRYAPEFVARYRAAQRERVARIDRIALDLVARRRDARQRLKEAPSRRDKLVASHQPVFTVWRTDADLRSWDTSLDPSDRTVGTLWGADPAASNLGSVGFGRVVTPESWLSTWSGLQSRASMALCAPSVQQPVLLVEYSGDNAVFPADIDAIEAAIGSPHKQRVTVRGNHHGMALAEGEPSGQAVAGEHVTRWLTENFG
ncbi:alpha/beta hydrolase [Aquabacterium sp. J223]|uniref:alpha/beta hydrolase n=1 Tax=Aquabacterium sp. J223 TaxID=2898431 RepID=UPI0021ADBD4D|nr:alpha/beta hydrolase [Aquabacterium sp. J223]UUX95211.1 alpha/beta hydrolase [Aquabacterium sp. J223]